MVIYDRAGHDDRLGHRGMRPAHEKRTGNNATTAIADKSGIGLRWGPPVRREHGPPLVMTVRLSSASNEARRSVCREC